MCVCEREREKEKGREQKNHNEKEIQNFLSRKEGQNKTTLY